MSRIMINGFRMTLAAIAGAGVLFGGDNVMSIKSGSLISEAQAIIGRPLTPMSYAGVARRTTYRAYGAYGAAVMAPVYAAPMYAPPVYATPACYQVVNAYGQLSTVCR